MNINSSLFGKIRPVLSEQSDIKDICETLSRGFSPLAVSGLSSIHKSQLAMRLSDHLYGEKSVPMLLIADDEAGAKKLCDDINEMYGETLAFVYPAKDITLARVDSVSREYAVHGFSKEKLQVLSGGKRFENFIDVIEQDFLSADFVREEYFL